MSLCFFDETNKPTTTHLTEDGKEVLVEVSLRDVRDIVEKEVSAQSFNRMCEAIRVALPEEDAAEILADDEELDALFDLYSDLEQSLYSIETPIDFPLLFLKSAIFDLHMNDDTVTSDGSGMSEEEYQRIMSADNSKFIANF